MGILNHSLPAIGPVKAVDAAIGWGRKSAIWPMTFGIACCAIEMMAVFAATFDLDRFGAGVPRATPRQSDLIIVPGTVNAKMAVRVKRLYDQMSEPRYVIAMGACVCGGGPYVKWGYNTVKGVHKIIPVDIFVPGCPPRPEALMDGILQLREKVGRNAVFARQQETAAEHRGTPAGPGTRRLVNEQDIHARLTASCKGVGELDESAQDPFVVVEADAIVDVLTFLRDDPRGLLHGDAAPGDGRRARRPHGGRLPRLVAEPPPHADVEGVLPAPRGRRA